MKVPVEDGPTEKLLHYTLIFQSFVFMQLFNQINARKLEPNEFNVFKNICNNSLFFVILIMTVAIQILMVQFGGKAVQTQPLSA